MAKLKPPKNYRRIYRRCCATCVYWVMDSWETENPSRYVSPSGGDYVCLRAPKEIDGDWNALEPEFHVCDGHKAYPAWQQEVA